jgi:hypothetical protein
MSALRAQLGYEDDPASDDLAWGRLQAGARVCVGEILFPKLSSLENTPSPAY